MCGDARAACQPREIGVQSPGYASNRNSDGGAFFLRESGEEAPPIDDKSEYLSILEEPWKKGFRMSGSTPSARIAHRRSVLNALVAVLLSVVLATSLTPQITWADQGGVSGEVPAAGQRGVDEQSTVRASCQVIGVDATGSPQVWAQTAHYDMPKGSDAGELSDRLFADAGLTVDASVGEYGYYLSTIASPYDGAVYGWDSATGKYWQLFVNGKASDSGASDVKLAEGDSIVWFYSSFGDELPAIEDSNGQGGGSDGEGSNPDEGKDTPSGSIEHPDLDLDWAGFNGGGTGALADNVATATTTTETKWACSLYTDEERENYAYGTASDPLIIGGKVYLVFGTSWPLGDARLMVIDVETGSVEQEVQLAAPKDSAACRPVYADGILVIPLTEGVLQAVSAADVTKTLWISDAIPNAQSVSSLTIADGFVYCPTADSFTTNYVASSGTIRRFDLYTGALSSQDHSDETGYYWAGGVMLNGLYLVPDYAGAITVYPADLSTTVSSVLVDESGITSSLAVRGNEVYAVSRAGVLYKLVLDEQGTLRLVDSLALAKKCTSSPVIVNDRLIVGGQADEAYHGGLYVVDISGDALVLERAVVSAAGQAIPREVQATPLVSVQGSDVFAYFTSNYTPGGVYCYKLGDAEAAQLYVPDEDKQNYCLASVFCGSDGTLYYTNDAGFLFALKGSDAFRIVFDSNGGSAVSAQLVQPGAVAVKPADPVREGYVFGGWYADADLTAMWDFSAPVTQALMLYAQWTKPVEPEPDPEPGTGGEGDNPNTTPGSGASGSGSTAAGGSANPAASSAVAGQAVAAAQQPVANSASAEESSAEAADSEASQDNGLEAAAYARTSASGPDGATALADGAQEGESAGLNPLALAGIVLGIAGLGCVAAFVVRARRKSAAQ